MWLTISGDCGDIFVSVDCGPGFEDVDGQMCTGCQMDYYKDAQGAGNCMNCPEGMITITTNSTSCKKGTDSTTLK